jgi:hypothetical protein
MVYEVGINDVDRPVQLKDGSTCPFYVRWTGMLRRCYKGQYEGTSVCKEWHRFSAFRAWMEQQDWEGKELDKDILGDGTIYSPDTCCFVSKSLNEAVRRNPKGYSKTRNGKFVAHLSINGKNKHLGTFDREADAKAAYETAKQKKLAKLLEEG